MTALVLAVARQSPNDSDFTVVALFGVVGLAISLLLMTFGINPEDLG